MATPWDPSDEVWPVRAGSATAINAPARDAPAPVTVAVKILTTAITAAMIATSRNARTDPTDQA